MRLQSASLFISILIHACVAVVLYFWVYHSAKPVVDLQKPALERGELSYVEFQGENEGVEKPRVVPKVAASKPAPSQTLNFKNLGVQSTDALKQKWTDQENGVATGDVASTGDPMTSVGDVGQGFSKATQYGQSMDVAFTNENLGFFQAIYNRVDGALVYPEDFVKGRREGHVYIEALLAKNGKILEIQSNRSDNDLLNAFSLALLVQVLKKPLPERNWLSTEQGVVQFEFEYKIRLEGMYPTPTLVGVQKNHLMFAREGVVDPLINEKIRDVFTHYIPPIIIFPGGFYVDLILAYQYVQNLRTHAPLESERRLARMKSMHQDLLRMIRESKREEPEPAPQSPPDTTPE